jgi:hypothetical protein
MQPRPVTSRRNHFTACVLRWSILARRVVAESEAAVPTPPTLRC